MHDVEAPDPPVREEPDGWEHYELFQRVKRALLALPAHYQSETHISGIRATDLHNLKDVIGATIEEQVVSTLNFMRGVWDPDDEYSPYAFFRQPQTFPDVVLRGPGESEEEEVLLGIELKNWYLLAKEGEPNFRFKVNREACNPWDLFATVPWALEQVISGNPTVMTPYVELARYVADYRGYYWQHTRDTSLNTTIRGPTDVDPYPSKADQIQDHAVADSGNNFGRIARTGVMDDYVEEIRHRAINGITIDHWLSFFQAFREGRSHDDISEELEEIGSQIQDELDQEDEGGDALRQILGAVQTLIEREG